MGRDCKDLGRRLMSYLRPGDRLAVRGADQVEGRMLRIDRDGLLVDLGRAAGEGAATLVEGRCAVRAGGAAGGGRDRAAAAGGVS